MYLRFYLRVCESSALLVHNLYHFTHTHISCLQQIRVFLSINLIMLFLFHMTSLRNLESSSFSYRLIFFAYELITAILKTTLVHEFKTPTM